MADPPFDPDAYLKKPFDPDAYLSTPPAVAPALDKYQQAAVEERDRLVKAGVPMNEGYTDRLARGATLGWSDEISAGAQVPLEMIRRGLWNPAEAYRYNKAFQDLKNKKIDENTAGALGAGVEILGGLGSAAGVLGGGTRAAAVTVPVINKTIPAGVVNYGQNIATGAGLGAVVGGGEAPDIASMPGHMLTGAAIGGGVSAALPPLVSGVSAVARAAQMPRLRDPQKIATEQVAKVVRDSGRTMDDVVREVSDAHAAGQTGYTIADALGKEGQRKLTAMAKVPGPQREEITELLTTRHLNMPHRVGEEVGQALGARESAIAATESLIERAGREAGPLYRQAEQHPGIWNDAIKDIISTKEAKSGLKRGLEIQRAEAAGTGRPFDPSDYAIVDFDKAGDPILGAIPNMRTLQAIKVGMDDIIEKAINPKTGKQDAYGRAVLGMKNRLLENIDAMNPVFREARQAYRGPMEVKDAVQQGREMATRGRAVDTIPAFRALGDAEQQGARIGYADAVRAPLERTGNIPTVLRAKSPKGAAELEELSLYQGPRQPGEPSQLRRFLTREEEMMRTQQHALGGPATAENLADIGAGPGTASEVLGLAGAAASGNPMGIAHGVLGLGSKLGRGLRGESEAQRRAITDLLLAREPQQVGALANELREYELRRRGVNPWVPGRPPRYRP